MTGEERKEYGMKVTQAGGSGLVVITYDIIAKYLDDAMAALNKVIMRNTAGVWDLPEHFWQNSPVHLICNTKYQRN